VSAPVTKAKVDLENDLAILRFEGDITSASRDQVLGTYKDLPKGGLKHILIDFTKVPYLNSSGIALVIQMIMAAKAESQSVRCFGLTAHFKKVFTMVGISKYATLYDDETAARAV
jgi:anti-sigma B factor antagonist